VIAVALIALVMAAGIVATIRALVTDGYRRVPTVGGRAG
jgi:hypothetical protein